MNHPTVQSAWGLVLATAFAFWITGCADGEEVTIAHWLEPCESAMLTSERLDAWCLRGGQDLESVGRLPPVIGFDFEWGVIQRVQVRKEHLRDQPTDSHQVEWHVEEVLSTSEWPQDETFEWHFGADRGYLMDGVLRRSEDFDEEWIIQPGGWYENATTASRRLIAATEEVEEMLVRVIENNRLPLKRMRLQYTEDRAEGPLIVHEVEVGSELDEDEVPPWVE